jgi:hypothetical protein
MLARNVPSFAINGVCNTRAAFSALATDALFDASSRRDLANNPTYYASYIFEGCRNASRLRSVDEKIDNYSDPFHCC